MGQDTQTGSISPDNVPFNIGGRSGGDLQFNGQIDEVEVFNRALLPSEIQDIYNANIVGKCKHGLIQFSSPTYSVGEAGTNATITVKRTDGSKGAVSATFNTSDGTATAGSDYTAVTNFTVSFTDGDTADKTIPIPITNDSTYEGDETVNLTLTNATGGAQIGPQGTAVLTIVDDDAPPSFSIDDVTKNEGNSGTTSFTFTITKTGSTAVSAFVDYETADGTAAAPTGLHRHYAHYTYVCSRRHEHAGDSTRQWRYHLRGRRSLHGAPLQPNWRHDYQMPMGPAQLPTMMLRLRSRSTTYRTTKATVGPPPMSSRSPRPGARS